MLLALLGLADPTRQIDAGGLVYPSTLMVTLVSAECVFSWRAVSGTLFDPYGIFLVAAVLFNAGQAPLVALGISPHAFLGGAFHPATLVRTLYLVALGLAAFTMGGILSLHTGERRRGGRHAAPQREHAQQDTAIQMVGLALLLVSALPTFLILRRTLVTVFASGYQGLFQETHATGILASNAVLSGFLVPGVFFLLAGGGRRAGPAMFAAGVILCYVAARFLVGSRGWAVMPLAAFAWLWHRRVRPIPTALLLAAALLFMGVVFPAIQATRLLAGSQRVSVSLLQQAFRTSDNPLISTVNEMGGSAVTIAHTIELVPATRDYDLGVGYGYALLTILPNLFWDVHPSIARGLPSDWLIRTVDPYTARLGGGLGYSFIAEAYLNFGWPGAPLVLAAMGFGLARMVAWAERGGDPARLAMIASALAFGLLFARGEAGVVCRALVWYSLLPYEMVLLLRAIARQHAAGPAAVCPAPRRAAEVGRTGPHARVGGERG